MLIDLHKEPEADITPGDVCIVGARAGGAGPFGDPAGKRWL